MLGYDQFPTPVGCTSLGTGDRPLESGRDTMSRLAAAVAIAFGAFACATGAGRAAEAASPPDFAPNPSVGWAATPGPFIPPPSGAGPVPPLDRRHASSNTGFFEKGTQPIF